MYQEGLGFLDSKLCLVQVTIEPVILQQFLVGAFTKIRLALRLFDCFTSVARLNAMCQCEMSTIETQQKSDISLT
ncbi:hypothetical protein AN477_19625 [Alicyclobacillus ferrooxydans]|uniref:Uncharacterized protein n=1 Tax=Alicyclobacillus ferrooxydans TaxID=471514 RepID=A0A0P9C9V5_9BACL|nr:hypothetical protein AN477_19625 [Alicyclobacillus ferrooxydans]